MSTVKTKKTLFNIPQDSLGYDVSSLIDKLSRIIKHLFTFYKHVILSNFNYNSTLILNPCQ